MIKNVVLREAKRGRTLLWVDQRSARKKLLNGSFFLCSWKKFFVRLVSTFFKLGRSHEQAEHQSSKGLSFFPISSHVLDDHDLRKILIQKKSQKKGMIHD